MDYVSVISNLLHFQQCTLSFNPLVVALAERGGPPLDYYFPYIHFTDPGFLPNAFICPDVSGQDRGPVSRTNVNLAHSQGLALIVVLNCYALAEQNLYVNGVLDRSAVTSNPYSIGSLFAPFLHDGSLPQYQCDFRSFFISKFSHPLSVPPVSLSVRVLSRIDNNCVSISLFPLPSSPSTS